MSAVNYLLLFSGNSNKGGFESSVRGFSKLEAAQTAMAESHKKFAAILNIPVGPNASSDKYTTRTKNSIRLERYGDYFQWEIIKAVPEDGELGELSSDPEGKRCHGLSKYMVTIEEHIAQEFSVKAYDIFHAVQSAETEYKKGRFVVQPSAPNAHLIMARDDETGDTTEWKEF